MGRSCAHLSGQAGSQFGTISAAEDVDGEAVLPQTVIPGLVDAALGAESRRGGDAVMAMSLSTANPIIIIIIMHL